MVTRTLARVSRVGCVNSVNSSIACLLISLRFKSQPELSQTPLLHLRRVAFPRSTPSKSRNQTLQISEPTLKPTPEHWARARAFRRLPDANEHVQLVKPTNRRDFQPHPLHSSHSRLSLLWRTVSQVANWVLAGSSDLHRKLIFDPVVLSRLEPADHIAKFVTRIGFAREALARPVGFQVVGLPPHYTTTPILFSKSGTSIPGLPGTEQNKMVSTTQTAEELDRLDPLRGMRDEFLFPCTNGAQDVYFVGNSLGLQPKSTQERIKLTLDHWQHLGVHGHFEPHQASPAWMDLPEKLSSSMANLVGAEADEVVVMNTLTVNLHLMMATFYQPTSKRFKVLIEDHAFPSDHQAVASHVAMRGYAPEEALISARPVEGSYLFDEDSLISAIHENRDELALILLPGIQYYTGQVLPMERLVAAAREYEIPIGLDLAHAAGNIPLSLSRWGPDFACWCTYKYMNCGPGALGGCYIRSDHAASQQLPRMAGWWGHERSTRFAMEPNFVPECSAQGWQLSNPPILAMAAMTPALELFEQAGGMPPLRAKSLKLNSFLRELLTSRLAEKRTHRYPRQS